MKLLISTLLMLGSLAVTSPSFAVDNSISKLCRPGADEAYSRTGGYCEQVASNVSLHPTSSSNPCKPWEIEVDDECVCAL